MGKLRLNIAAGVLCSAAGLLLITGFSQSPERENGLDNGPEPPAVTVVPVQIGRDSYGIAMVDTQAQTVWIYQFDTRGQTFEQLRLIAARSFAYDRQLTEWNTGTPTPTQVRNILEAMKTRQPTPPAPAENNRQNVEELQQLLEQE